MIKIGIVGCGRISKKHLEAIDQVKEFQLTATCDVDHAKADEVAQKYKVQPYYDYDEFLNKADLDIVDVCTPSGLHPEMGTMAAKKGYHVILEKPMGVRYKKAEDLVNYCEQKKLKLFVVKQNRFNAPILKLKEAIGAGRFGKLITSNTTVRWKRTQEYYDMADWRGTWEYDGGVLMNQASHHVDLLQWLVGDVKSVFAKVNTYLHNVETDDTAIAVLEFKNGALGTIEATTCTSPVDLEGSVTILGEKGTVKVGGFAVNRFDIWKFEDSLPNEEEEVKQLNQNPPNVYGFGHIQYFQNVKDVILNNAKPMTDGRSGLKNFKLAISNL